VHRLGVVVILFVVTGSACIGPGTSSSTVSETPTASSEDNPMDRLTALAASWFKTSASVVYRTTAPVPGQPTTAHLCLRQMFDDDFGEDRTALLRRCSRQGTLRLLWDPPDGWRMDVITPVDRFRLVSTPDGSLRCERVADPNAPCRSISSRRAQTASPFGFLLMAPDEILEEVGAPLDSVQASPAGDLIGEQLECFRASGPEEHVEWCYSRDGLLLSFLRGSAAGGWTSIEATSVSR
jgi:hypothetical protein